ncbi:NAD-dependent epimerase/dehydratase [Fimicolochytrium jonesii]|uniref:NAD-dependent epimerase/dehydratase n=1 Tax=Fimicolochytrium jonesii TaxID=1396493 RepID=UPI0022FEBD76|nr:NAD-dependent epimerase/dehydratase [Fimicolochytrium jonesii]KAI8818516.1 NAD-dependent epimerase/dehydratase [Fimicolochytrium jonesii]
MHTDTKTDRILVTGSAGDLGKVLYTTLKTKYPTTEIIGLDVRPSPTTTLLASITDKVAVAEAMEGVTIVFNAAALHRPHMETHTDSDFVDTNVTGTLNLLEAATADGSMVRRFVHTSTTSVMVPAAFYAKTGGGSLPMNGSNTEVPPLPVLDETSPTLPRNIYGVTKLTAEHLCRIYATKHSLPITVLRTSRFFPEEHDLNVKASDYGPREKAIEILSGRRGAVADMVDAHIAMAFGASPTPSAPLFRTFVVSARSPLTNRPELRERVKADPHAVVLELFPEYPEAFVSRGWEPVRPGEIDRVYSVEKIVQEGGWAPSVGFREILEGADF